MSDEKQNIIDELKKTGYPTEIVSASVMQEARWSIMHSPSYLDQNKGISREFDIIGYDGWSFGEGKQKFTVSANLITECKKSDAAWVFFTTPEDYSEYARLGRFIKHKSERIAFGKRPFTAQDTSDSLISDEKLRSFHHYFQKPYLARTFHEPFKHQEKADASPKIYRAIMSVVKATLFYCQDQPWSGWLNIYYPIIVLDGNLYEARVGPDKSIELDPSEHVQLTFNYMLPAPKHSHSVWQGHQMFMIDVVHESYLNKFLQLVREEHIALRNLLKDAFDKATAKV